MFKKVTLFLILLLILLCGCATPPKFMVDNWTPGRIAVLPFKNHSADVSVEQFARVLLFDRLTKKKFDVIPLEEIDEALGKLGITEGGQLETVTIAELQKAIPADSYLFGTVIEAKRVMLGIYFDKSFEADFVIKDVRTGETAWQDDRKASEKKVVLNPNAILETAAREMIKEVAYDSILKAINSHPLYEQMERVVNISVSTLPKAK